MRNSLHGLAKGGPFERVSAAFTIVDVESAVGLEPDGFTRKKPEFVTRAFSEPPNFLRTSRGANT